jgi:hypothetical protein
MRIKLIIVVAACVLLIVVLVPVVYYYFYVPSALGKKYVSVSFKPAFLAYDGARAGDVNGTFEGKPFTMDFLGISVNASNSYFVPVQVRYNGFDVVWLIYNQTVSDPSDVSNNERLLVWGAYYHLVDTSYPHSGVYDFSEDGIEYYANRRELSNYTITLDPGQYWGNYPMFWDPDVAPGSWTCQYWFNQYLSVPLGTYYMYCIIFGIPTGPQNLTLTSIP